MTENAAGVIDDRSLEVLWVIARNGHATEKVIMVTLRKNGTPVRHRFALHRCLKKLLLHGLIVYEEDFREYVVRHKAVYARKEVEERAVEYRRQLWKRIKDEYEFQRAFGTPP